MTIDLRLGYVPLLDAAPLVVAETLGFAEAEGIALTLAPAPSWAALRDMLATGLVDGAQMLSVVPVAQALGLAPGPARFEALAVLNLNGDTIGVSAARATALRGAGQALPFGDATGIADALFATGAPLRIGVPFPFSMHAELLHLWIEATHPTAAPLVEIVTVPPPLMAAALAEGEIDAFAVGEPWGSVAVEAGVAEILLPSTAIWAAAPEKVLAVRQGWADAEPDAAARLLRALWQAGRWLADPAHRALASEVLTAPGRLGVSADLVERILSGRLVARPGGPDMPAARLIDFHSGAATFPWRSQAAWIGDRLARRHGIDPRRAAETARSVFRSDIYRAALTPTGADLPGASQKLEGALDVPTSVASSRGRLILPPDRFFDARIFDPASIG